MKVIHSSAPALMPIRRSRLYEQVAEQIQELIVSSTWIAGRRIPCERDLGEQFGVSRTVVREALKALSERGLISVTPGRGIFVAEPSSDALSDPMRLLLQRRAVTSANLVEARQLLEIEIAGLAARRHLPGQLARMKAAIDEMDLYRNSPDLYIKADQKFHVALADATQNGVLRLLIDSISGSLEETRRVIFQVDGSPARGQEYHRQLFDAVVRRDPAAARRIMREHLHQFETDVRAAESS
ncbi:MAG TPA: FadR/GntR family transcriptional regulator [Chloroflexota bacterium]